MNGNVRAELWLVLAGCNLGAGVAFLGDGRWVLGAILVACGVVGLTGRARMEQR